MTKANTLKISSEVVHSEEYLPLAAKAVAEAYKQVNPTNLDYQDKLDTWAETGGHLPVIMGSGMAVDAPYLLNKMVEEENSYKTILTMCINLLNGNDRSWKEAYRLSRAVRNA